MPKTSNSGLCGGTTGTNGFRCHRGTLTMHIWSLLKDGIAPRVNALATVLLGASFVLLLVGTWVLEGGLGGRRVKRA